MFGSHVFHSWLSVLLGGLLFAILFGLVEMMSELVMDGEMRVSNKTVSLGALAFVGYIGVATIIKIRKTSEE